MIKQLCCRPGAAEKRGFSPRAAGQSDAPTCTGRLAWHRVCDDTTRASGAQLALRSGAISSAVRPPAAGVAYLATHCARRGVAKLTPLNDLARLHVPVVVAAHTRAEGRRGTDNAPHAGDIATTISTLVMRSVCLELSSFDPNLSLTLFVPSPCADSHQGAVPPVRVAFSRG